MEEKKQKIFEASLRIIADNGLHNAPMSVIAREAGVAAGTIYHYFSGKEDMVLKLYLYVKQNLGEQLIEAVPESGHLIEVFRSYWRNLFQFYIQHPYQFAFLQHFDNSPFADIVSDEEIQQYYLPAMEVIRKGQQNQIFIDLPDILLIEILNGQISALAKMQLKNKLEITEDILEKSIQYSWNSITKSIKK